VSASFIAHPGNPKPPAAELVIVSLASILALFNADTPAFGKGQDSYVPITPSPCCGNTFWGMAFVSQNQIASLLSRKEYYDVACLTEMYSRGEMCWALFYLQRIHEYLI
jgi:hypothetical protein